MGVLTGLEPESVFNYFEEIAKIPHGSGNTDRISNYLVDFAKEHGLKYIQDKMGNVIIFKDATDGYEDKTAVIIQGHMDMVCEKEKDCDIDFTRDGLSLVLDGNRIYAEGTTLGGDDGIAVAYALAILAADDIPHPRLEVVITVDEEIGMLGASGLDGSVLTGKYMLNIDSEEEGSLLVSCAGGISACAALSFSRDKVDTSEGSLIKISVCDAAGGHSGVEIDKQRANANKVLARVMYSISDKCRYRLIDIRGGEKDNAIPRAASACIYLERDGDYDILVREIDRLSAVISAEYMDSDREIKVIVSPYEGLCDGALSYEDSIKCISFINILPDGVQRMSHDIEGLVQTSLNLGILKTDTDRNELTVKASFSVRSSVGSEKEELVERLTCIAKSFGGTLTLSGDYPAWEYRRDSRLRDCMTSIYERMYGCKPKLEAIHAGLECGLFASMVEDLDCVSYGPDISDIHTTAETLYVDSVKRMWEYTLEILKNL